MYSATRAASYATIVTLTCVYVCVVGALKARLVQLDLISKRGLELMITPHTGANYTQDTHPHTHTHCVL